MPSKKEEVYLSRGEQLVNITLVKAIKIIKKKYNINPCGISAAMPGGPIQKLGLCFDTRYPYTKEQLREIVIGSAQELLDQVNKNEEIQEFLKVRPFTIKNIQIIIYNHDKNGGDLLDPEIATAQILRGTLSYRTTDPENTFVFKNRFYESYEEGLQALNR